MNAPVHPGLTRRRLLATGGVIMVSFALTSRMALAQSAGAQSPPKLPGSLHTSPMLDSWIAIDGDGKITVFTGKAELGQGIMTALIQCAAEELGVAPSAITLVTADTERTPNEGYTAGSHSMQDSGTAILNAAAQVRALLIAQAAGQLKVPAEQLTRDGAVLGQNGIKAEFKDLVKGLNLHVRAQPASPLKKPDQFTIIGKPLPRVDIPGKVTGQPAFVQDLRFDRMLHARVVRPPNYHAQLVKLDAAPVEKLPGVVKVVRDGSFLAVAAQHEFQAIEAMHALSAAARWNQPADLPDEKNIFEYLKSLPSNDTIVLDKGAPGQQGAHHLTASYERPYGLHGSIGPSCAVARFDGDKLTVWTHTQGVFPLRNALADMLHLPAAQVHCIQVEGSGCYGHNAADDAAADAALIARAIPGRPVRVQWMREQEHGWEPFGPAMSSQVAATLDANGKLVAWQYDVWSNTHSTRPAGPAGNLLAARYLAQPFPEPAPKPIPLPDGGGDRNSIPLYAIPNAHIVFHFIPQMPVRVSALRALGAYHNVFSIESFMDELAAVAKIDPVEFRLRHLDDPRARAVIEKVVKEFDWKPRERRQKGLGHGFAFARYKNSAAYCAIAVQLTVEHETGRVTLGRIVAAVDSGQVVNPDGIRNQIEGAIVQSASWTLYEQVTFDKTMITSRDWSSFPMLRFPAVPQSVEVHVINQPGAPFLGTGEAGQGPTAAAIANAVADATGVHIRTLPLTSARVKAAIGV